MKHKRRRKRKPQTHPPGICQTAVLLNSAYFDVSPVHVDRLLPSLPDADNGFGVVGAYCAMQPSDSGDVLLFFRTRWAYRRGIQIRRFSQNPPAFHSSIVFDLIHEGEAKDFYKRLGYDVPWDTIIEIVWEDFVVFISKVLTDSLARLLAYHKMEGNDRIVCKGDLRWVSTEYREAIDFLQEQQTQ